MLSSFGQQNSIQNEFNIIIEKIGDLDGDGIGEKVAVYEIKDSAKYGNLRELWIFRNKNGKWIKWIKTNNVNRKSTGGEVISDTLEEIEIKNNVLSIHFYGGTNWKWVYTDKYKFQNNQFELIGYTHSNFKTCDYWDYLDFNLLTGKIILKTGYENCEKQNQKRYTEEIETFYHKGVKVTLQKRKEEEIKIVSPNGKTIYLF